MLLKYIKDHSDDESIDLNAAIDAARTKVHDNMPWYSGIYNDYNNYDDEDGKYVSIDNAVIAGTTVFTWE